MIHPTALVSPRARLGLNVRIGAFTIVHDDVELGDGSEIGSHCEIGHPTARADGRPLVIGAGALIRSHSVFYTGSTFGPELRTGHQVTVREGTVAGARLQIGTLGDVQGACRIGDDVRFHSNVQVNHHTTIGNFVWLFPHVVLANDPHPPSDLLLGVTLEDFVAVAAMSLVLPGVTVRRGALIGAHSTVTRDVEPDTVVVGSPARVAGAPDALQLRDGSGRPAYPWRRHFSRGYPDEAVAAWLQEFGADRAAPFAD
jgi:acyl-[acyl carrier protein]--UDP-N-acetylglucosamine O-acyltransferase